jgi:hypothetical protein
MIAKRLERACFQYELERLRKGTRCPKICIRH